MCRLAMSIPDVPFVITWASINIAEGILMLLFSLLAIAIAAAQLRSLAVPYAVFSFFCYVVQLALYATTQARLLPKSCLFQVPVYPIVLSPSFLRVGDQGLMKMALSWRCCSDCYHCHATMKAQAAVMLVCGKVEVAVCGCGTFHLSPS